MNYFNLQSMYFFHVFFRKLNNEPLVLDLDMATSPHSKIYGPPKTPKTPSRAINNMLDTRCGKPFDSQSKYIIASIICGVFTLITMMYNQIHKDKLVASHKMWMISCGTVSVAGSLGAYLAYSIIIGCSFFLHALLYYGCVMTSLAAIGLCVSGMVFFDKEGVVEGFEKEN